MNIDTTASFKRMPLSPLRNVVTANLANDRQQYCIFFYHETEELPNKIVIEFKTADNEVRSLGFINKLQLEQFIMDLCYAHIYDLKKRSNPDIPLSEFISVQLHNLKKNISEYVLRGMKK